MKKALYILALAAGLPLMLASTCEHGTSNIVGVLLVWYGCSKLNLFYREQQ